jgi:antitoxin MazE
MSDGNAAVRVETLGDRASGAACSTAMNIPGVFSDRQEAAVPVTSQKWGHNVGVRLRKPMLEQIGLGQGAQVDVLVEGDHLVIRRARRRPTLDDLLDRCKPENRPEQIDWGPDVGREIVPE